MTEMGTVQLTDFFVIARDHKARFYDFTSLHPTQKLVRMVTLEAGNSVPMALMLDTRPHYGRCRVAWTLVSDNPLRYSSPAANLYSDIAVNSEGDQLTGDFSAEKAKPILQCWITQPTTDHRISKTSIAGC